MKKTLLISFAALVTVGGLWWLNHLCQGPPSPAESTTELSSSMVDASEGADVQPAASTKTHTPWVPTTTPSRDAATPVDAVYATEVRTVLAELERLYGPAGWVDWDAAKALIAARQQATRELVERLAALGPGGARAIAASYAETGSVRARMLLVQALGRVRDKQAAGVLHELLRRDDSLSLCKEMILALAKRGDAASEQTLAGVLSNDADAQLRFASAQALAGRESALPLLVERVQSDISSEVRRELVRSIGMIGSPAAKIAMAQIAGAPGDLALREAAIQELSRGFGAASLPDLETLLKDSNPAIRASSVKSLARMRTDSANVLLKQAANTDTSAFVRDVAIGAVRRQ